MLMSVVERINTVFNNNDFLMSALDGKNKFDEDRLYHLLTITLTYFLATYDTRTFYSAEEVEEEYKRINSKYLTPEEVESIIARGFLTHSFNTSERKFIEKYGFDYWAKITAEERMELIEIRHILGILEQELGKNKYLSYREQDKDIALVEQEVYMTVPGTKTIHYAKNAPERLYHGPMGEYWRFDFPMVVGESKKDYFMRILRYRIENCTYNVDQDELADLAEKIIEYYVGHSSSIAFINFLDMLDKPVYTISYGMYGENCLRDYHNALLNSRYKVEHIFSHQRNDRPESFEIGNLVTLAKHIPKDLSFVSFPDVYALKQQYLKSVGVPDGVPVSYTNCTRISSLRDYPQNIQKLYR